MFTFIKAYIKSMRLYYAFITGIAGWVGVACYEYNNHPLPIEKKIVLLLMLFLSWGINQIFNDYLGQKEDRINAPHRPMVTGELNAKAALIVSSMLLIVVGVITFLYFEPIAFIPMLAGVLLNIVYEYAKGFGVLGNIVFGVMIGMCTLYGFFASGPIHHSTLPIVEVAVWLLVCLMNAIMTYYTYFKDYEGDKATGKNTIVVKYGIEKAKWIGLLFSFLPMVFLSIFCFSGILPLKLNNTFIILSVLTFFLELWTGILYFRSPTGNKTYYSLAINFRACACGQAALIAIYDEKLSILLFLVTYIFVGFLFDLHQIERETKDGNYSQRNL